MKLEHLIIQEFLKNENNIITLQNADLPIFHKTREHLNDVLNKLKNIHGLYEIVYFHYYLIECDYFPYIEFLKQRLIQLNQITWVAYDEDTLHDYVKQTIDKCYPRHIKLGETREKRMHWFINFFSNPLVDDCHKDEFLGVYRKTIINSYYAIHIYNCRNKPYVDFCVAQRLKRVVRVVMIYDGLQTECLDEPCLLADEYVVFNIVKFL